MPEATLMAQLSSFAARTHVGFAWKFVWLSRFQRDNVRAIIELVYTLDTAITWLVVRSSLVCIIASSSSWFWAEAFVKSHVKHLLNNYHKKKKLLFIIKYLIRLCFLYCQDLTQSLD